MAIPVGPIVARIVKEGMSARAGLALAREAGVQVRDATWFRIVSEAKRSLTTHADEASKPVNRKPTGADIAPLTTRTARGYIQYVEVYARDAATGLVARRPYAIRGSTLVTRQAAITEALDAMTANSADEGGEYDESILFAVYTATYALTPGLD